MEETAESQRRNFIMMKEAAEEHSRIMKETAEKAQATAERALITATMAQKTAEDKRLQELFMINMDDLAEDARECIKAQREEALASQRKFRTLFKNN